MPNTQSGSKLSDETVGQLQGTILEAILAGSPLPGHSRPLDLPDLPLVLSQPAIVLSSENLGGPIHVEGPTRPIEILSEEVILERAQSQGDFPYLHFQPPQSVQGGMLFTLQIRIAQRERSKAILGLSGVQVTFRQSGRGWQAADDPAAFAS